MLEEKNLDFDTIIDRKKTDCLKYDFAEVRGMPKDILPLWVADMDFKTSSIVLDVLKERIEHGIFGYTETGNEYFEAVADWMRENHSWEIKADWMIKTPGVVIALALAVRAYTQEGEAVLIQEPVYYPFTEVIKNNNRVKISNDLVLGEDGKYHIDFEDFEKKIIENNIHLFLLCNPHNPVGRVWTKEELMRLGHICLKHGVKVVSDEIHEDFVYGTNKHVVFANLSNEFADISITCTSPAKTFNLAGLQISNIFIPNAVLRSLFRKQLSAIGYSQLNTLGLTACVAAYRHGDIWYKAMLQYVQGNIDFVREYMKKYIPEIRMIEPEGTYLVWLDFRGLGLEEKEQKNLVVNRAGLWLDRGAIFGKVGERFERVNVACPRAILERALKKLGDAINVYREDNC